MSSRGLSRLGRSASPLGRRRVVALSALSALCGLALVLGLALSGVASHGTPASADTARPSSAGAHPAAAMQAFETPAQAGAEVRRFHFDYEVVIPAEVAIDDGPLRVFLPIATDGPGQRILDVQIDSPVAGRLDDGAHGNRTWSVTLPARRAADTEIVVRYAVERSVVRAGDERGDAQAARKFLAANERVVVDHPILLPILEEIRARSPGADPAQRARAIYDWVVDNVEYKKVGSGWGNGDTFWACNERYGNCTDFHSLFISLARTEGIPARFQMGFPIPTDRLAGTIGGYHCWVEFWLPEAGWVPIDASEAFKHPDKRELFYGTHPADRMRFTTGRDLRLGPEHEGRPLNYFIHPYLEAGGVPLSADVRAHFRYRVEGTAADAGESAEAAGPAVSVESAESAGAASEPS